VAGHTETVLVSRRNGYGKELVARTIHGSSIAEQAAGRYHCAALPEHLVGANCSGYEKGPLAAPMLQPGLFELADKGQSSRRNWRIATQIQRSSCCVFLDGAP